MMTSCSVQLRNEWPRFQEKILLHAQMQAAKNSDLRTLLSELTEDEFDEGELFDC